MNGALEIRNKLKIDSAVLALIGTTAKVQIGIVSPDSWALSDTTCLIYKSGITDHTLEYFAGDFTVNCRAEDEGTSQDLQDAVIDALNRQSCPGDSGIFKCQAYETIEPVDENDNYNTPVLVNITGK